MPVTIDLDMPGSGPPAEADSIIIVNYTVQIAPDIPLEGQMGPTETIEMPIDGHMLIVGWSDGILGRNTTPTSEPMRVGGTRRFTVPPDLAYAGSMGKGIEGYVPANATLIFDVELRGVHAIPT